MQIQNLSKKEQLLFLCGVALAIRLLLGYFTHGFLFIDEVRQYLDVAAFKLFGTGELTWEWSSHIRSMIVPQLLTLILKLSVWIGMEDPFQHVFFIRIFLSIWSLILIVSSYEIVSILYPDKKIAPFVTAMICAVWGYLIYFNLRTLGECMAMPVMMGSLWLLLYSQKNSKPWISIASGFLIGIAFIIKCQTSVIIISSCLYLLFEKDLKRFSYLCMGFFIGVGIQGISDWISYGTFLESPIAYFKYNILNPPSTELRNEAIRIIDFLFKMHFPVFFPFIAYFTFKNFKKNRLLCLSILVYVGIHAFISNRQFRFYAPLLPFFLTASIPSFLEWIEGKQAWVKKMALAALILALASQLGSLVIPAGAFRPEWNKHADILKALSFVGKQKDSTGVLAVTGYDRFFFYLGKSIPYVTDGSARKITQTPEYSKFNYLLLNTKAKDQDNKYLDQERKNFKEFPVDQPPFRIFGSILIFKRRSSEISP